MSDDKLFQVINAQQSVTGWRGFVATPFRQSSIFCHEFSLLPSRVHARPTWLDLAHKRLDEAVLAAYGWNPALGDEEILEKLLALNLERSRDESSS
jgi:hypothetical protein